MYVRERSLFSSHVLFFISRLMYSAHVLGSCKLLVKRLPSSPLHRRPAPDSLKIDLHSLFKPYSGASAALPPLINVRSISKAFGADPLFQNVSFTVSEGDRIGLIGPNGSGKSTLLRILAGTEDTDDGEIGFRKRLRMSYVEQESEFRPGDTVRSVVDAALKSSRARGRARHGVSPKRWGARVLWTWKPKQLHSPGAGRNGWRLCRRWCGAGHSAAG